MITVFLSGPMRGIQREETVGWRLACRRLMPNVRLLDPMRGRREEETLPSGRLAVARDLSDVAKADVLLVSDTYSGVSMAGTAIEIHQAKTLGKIVIAFGTAHRNDYFLSYFIDYWFDSLEEAASFIERRLNDEDN